MNWIDFSKTVEQRSHMIELDKNQLQTRNDKLNGHTLVRGVAGSGKSLLIRERVERIVKETNNDKILVLTYNRFMAGWIQHLLCTNSSIDCRTFHSWASGTLKYNYNTSPSVFQEKARVSTEKYDAILIDEAQDFKDEWFVGLLNLLNPLTNSLFFAYDNTQSVYGNSHRRKGDWSWAKLGIKIVGRTDILDVNYRNSPEIGLAAWNFFSPYIKRAKVPISRDSAGAIVKPIFKKSRSSGVTPSLHQCSNYMLIAREVADSLAEYQESSIAIMMHPDIKDSTQKEISIALEKLGVDHDAPPSSKDRNVNVLKHPWVIIDSWNVLKGLEFDAVILINIDYVNRFLDKADEFKQFSGLYTAMTRAKDHLVMLYEKENKIVNDIKSSIEKTRVQIHFRKGIWSSKRPVKRPRKLSVKWRPRID